MSISVKPKNKKISASIDDEIFKYVKLLTKCPSKICCISYYWNQTQSRFASFNEKSKPTGRNLKWFVFNQIKNGLVVYGAGLVLQLILMSGLKLDPDRPLIQPLMESMAIIAVGGCLFGRWMYSNYSLSFTNCLNNLLTYLNRNKCKIF